MKGGLLFAVFLAGRSIDAFLSPFPTSTRITTNLYSSATTKSSFPQINVVKLDPSTYDTEDDQIMQLASYRNQRMSPEQMIASQQAKRDSFDPVKSALDGAKIGLGIGAAAGIITAVNGDGYISGLSNFAAIGLTTASLLAYNNYSGNRVYVMDMKEARNRLTVDFVASLKISQDIGFAAYLESSKALTFKNGRFEGCNGIVGCVDCQLRNSKFNNKPLENGVMPKEYPGLPPHVHIKNMDVDETIRRKGIGRQLMDTLETYARTTDAEILTLEVRDDNDVAVRLYENCGFAKDESIKSKKGGCSFMVKQLI